MNNLLASEATFTVITSHSPTSHSVFPYARSLTKKKKRTRTLQEPEKNKRYDLLPDKKKEKKILYAGTKVIHFSFIGQDSGKRPSDWNMETQCAS